MAGWSKYIFSILSILASVKQNMFSSMDAAKPRAFHREGAIHLKEKMQAGCIEKYPETVRSLVECGSFCNDKESCIGVSLDQDSNCYFHSLCPAVKNLGGRIHYTDHIHTYMRLYYLAGQNEIICLNGGTWDKSRNRCSCKYGWVGNTCNRLARICYDLFLDGYKGYYNFANLNISSQNEPPIWAICYKNKKGFTNVHFMSTPQKKGFVYNKTYDEYIVGFGGGRSNYWLGLENWYRLGKYGFKTLHIYLRFLDLGYMFRYTYNVEVLDSSTGYAMKISFTHHMRYGNYGEHHIKDMMSALQGIPFSTWDNDNDGDKNTNCAAEIGNGFWFKGCDPLFSNFMGTNPASESLAGLVIFPGINFTSLGTNRYTLRAYLKTPAHLRK